MTITVLDNVASGIEGSITTGGPIAVWVTGGLVDIVHQGDVIHSIEATTERKLIDVGVDQIITLRATAAATTAMATSGSAATRRGYPRLVPE